MKKPKLMKKPEEFSGIRSLLFDLFQRLNYKGFQFDAFYVKLWNPINYAIIGGIGVIINFLVWMATIQALPWFLSNFLAIICAWAWNWSQAVGPFCKHWGFEHE